MKQNRITGVIGAKGEGKTTWAMEEFRKSGRAIAFDIMGEYCRCLMVQDRLSLVEFLEGRNRFRIAFRPGVGEQANQDLNLICRVAFACGKLNLFLEEADYFCTPASADPALDRIVRYGRHAEVNLTYTTRRFQEISKGLTAQTDEYVLFRVSEPRDLEAMAKRFGEEIAARVQGLRQFECVRVNVTDIGREGHRSEPAEDRSLRSDGAAGSAGSGVGEQEPAAEPAA